MSLGTAEIVKSDYATAIEAKIAELKAAYDAARAIAQQTMQALCPVATGALKQSSKTEPLSSGIGFVMRSFGDEASGKAYAAFVNGGHHINLKGGGARFVPAQPYFSQAEADARAALLEALRSTQ